MNDRFWLVCPILVPVLGGKEEHARGLHLLVAGFPNTTPQAVQVSAGGEYSISRMSFFPARMWMITDIHIGLTFFKLAPPYRIKMQLDAKIKKIESALVCHCN